MLRNTDIKKRTEEFWEYKCNYDCYVGELLGRELAEARKDDPARLRGLASPVHALAMTVGDSFEPLLQTICVLRPQRLILILNRVYADKTPGMDHGSELCRLVKKLMNVPDIPDDLRPALTDQRFDIIELPQPDGRSWRRATNRHFDLIEIAQDTPTEVFRALLLAFQAAQAQPPAGLTNAVDITGAKKSMVVGAFLYAAHSQIPITYVDFDNDAYNRDFHRTYGYKCRIGKIADPYEAFQLRDWERVSQLYKRYDFRGARELIGQTACGDREATGILGVMSGHLDGNAADRGLYDQNPINKVERLARVLEMYEAWDSGDYNTAADQASKLPDMKLPTVIQRFGGRWSRISGCSLNDIPPGFYGDEESLKIYAHDELARIRRLIDCNEDNRSAFLRAAGLNEVLLTARLARLVIAESDRQAVLTALDAHTPMASTLFKALLGELGTVFSTKSLGLKIAPPLRLGLPQPMKPWWSSTHCFAGGNDWKQFLDLRNRLAHTFTSVSKELAEEAISFVQANFEDFIGSPISSLTTEVEALAWHELCTVCELLDFLPPKLRD